MSLLLVHKNPNTSIPATYQHLSLTYCKAFSAQSITSNTSLVAVGHTEDAVVVGNTGDVAVGGHVGTGV